MRNDIRDLVKAKRIDDGEWIEGFLTFMTIMGQQYHVVRAGESTFYPVEEDSICRCIGIFDIHEKPIYEKDIIRHYNNDNAKDEFRLGVILWNPEQVSYEMAYICENKPVTCKLRKGYRYEIVKHMEAADTDMEHIAAIHAKSAK